MFKLQICQDIRSGQTSRLQAQRLHGLSSSLVSYWLAQYDLGELDSEEAESVAFAGLQRRCAELERTVDRLTRELKLACEASTAGVVRQRVSKARGEPTD